MPSNYPKSYRELHNVICALKPLGAVHPINLGQCSAFQLNPEVNRIPIYEYEPGNRKKVDEFINEATYAWDLTIDEITPEVARMLHFASEDGSAPQAAAANLSATFQGVKKGVIMNLQKENVLNVVVTVGGIQKSPVTDYYLDAGLGILELRLNTSIADGADVVVSYGCAATTRTKFTPMAKTQQEGVATLYVKDKFGATAVEIVEGECSYYVTDFGSHDLQKIREVKIRIIFRGTPTMTRR